MIYLTNNIVESINSKLSYYLSKRITNKYNFIKSINNILINDAIDNNNKNKRYDFKTQSQLLLIEKEGINKKFKWINFAQFKYYLNLIVKDNHIENIEGEYDKLFKLIGEDILDSDDEKIDDFNNEININTESENSMEVEESENNNLETDEAEKLELFVNNFEELKINENVKNKSYNNIRGEAKDKDKD